MDELAAQQPGYLGIESVRSETGDGITVSYWTDDDAARAWKANAEHLLAQEHGRARWYDRYRLRVATVQREYSFARPIFHLAMPSDWSAAQDTGVYTMSTRGVTIEHEGFMHCSFRNQIRGVVDRFYDDVDELVILHLDRAQIDDDIRLEPPADGIAELFPHLYRALPVAAVISTTPWRRASDGWGDPPVR
jgi:glutathione S-transferase